MVKFKFGGGGNKPSYVPPDKKGEIAELKAALRDPTIEKDKIKRRELLQRVVGYMTMGLDTSRLFSEMILAVHTKDLVQKKMVYLYICNYAESNPGLAILAINTLRKDYRDESPIVRGLALRSIASLRLPNIVEYLLPMIKSGLVDPSPYVRKTAVTACIKLYRMSPQTIAEEGLVDKLYSMLRDIDVSVVTNAIQALNEIQEDQGGIAINKQIIYHLVNRIKEYNEWQICLILELLLKYTPSDEDEIFDIMNILEDRFKHSNSAVILAAANIFLKYTEHFPDVHKQVYMRLKDPLVTLMATSSSEVAWTILSHIKLLVGREPLVFASSFKDFFCRYTDSWYVKELKLEILTAIATEDSVNEIMQELSEYVSDVDKETASRAIRALGQITVKIPAAAENGIKYLLTFLDLGIDFVVTETFIVLKDILRRYENDEFCRNFLPSITRHWKSLEDPESKAAFIWILGEYGDMIDSAPYIIETCIDDFDNQHYSVKTQLLTSSMKLFFRRAPEMHKMLGRLLSDAVADYSHADVRDRALLYYRMLTKNPDEAQRVIGSKKDLIIHFSEEENEFQDRLFEEFNTLSVVFNEPSERFLAKAGGILGAKKDEGEEDDDDEEEDEEVEEGAGEERGDEDEEEPDELESSLLAPEEHDTRRPTTPTTPTCGNQAAKNTLDSLLDFSVPAAAAAAAAPPSALDDFISSAAAPSLSLSPAAELKPKAFQQKWAQLPMVGTTEIRLGTKPPAQEITDALLQNNIICMASGEIAGTYKFYFFAQKEGSAEYFLSETIVNPDGLLVAKFKCDNDKDAQQFIETFRSSF